MKHLSITHVTKDFRIEVVGNKIHITFNKMPQFETDEELDNFLVYLLNLGEAALDFQPATC